MHSILKRLKAPVRMRHGVCARLQSRRSDKSPTVDREQSATYGDTRFVHSSSRRPDMEGKASVPIWEVSGISSKEEVKAHDDVAQFANLNEKTEVLSTKECTISTNPGGVGSLFIKPKVHDLSGNERGMTSTEKEEHLTRLQFLRAKTESHKAQTEIYKATTVPILKRARLEFWGFIMISLIAILSLLGYILY